MEQEKVFIRMNTQQPLATLCRYYGVEGEEDSHSRCDDQVLTYHLESLDVGPTVGEQLGGHDINDSQDLHGKEGGRKKSHIFDEREVKVEIWRMRVG